MQKKNNTWRNTMIKYTKEDIEKSDNDAGHYPGKNFDKGSYYCEVAEVRDGNRPNQYGICFKEVQSGKIICWDNLTFSEKALGIAHKKLQSIDPAFKVNQEYNEQNLVGKRVTLLLEYETYKENTSLRPKFKSKNFGYIADNDVAF